MSEAVPHCSLPVLAIGAAAGRSLAALDLLQHAVWLLDPARGRVLHGNAAALRLWHADSLEALIARDLSGVSESMRIRTDALVRRLARGETARERCTFYPAGRPALVECQLRGALVEIDGCADRSFAMLIEASEVAMSAEDLRSLEAIRHAGAPVSLYDGDGGAIYCNPAALAAYDGRRSFRETFCDPAAATSLWRRVREVRDVVRAVVETATAAGPRWHAVELRPTLDPATGADCVLVAERDITPEVEAKAEIERAATHDGLTGLANRLLFNRRLAALMDEVEVRPFGLLCLDLDRFKAVNDTLGHGAGDALLCGVAMRLRACVSRAATVARLGGDEFAILVPGLSCERPAHDLGRAIIREVGQPYALDEGAAEVGVSVGVVLAKPALSADRLLKIGDSALYRAKRLGRGRVCTAEDVALIRMAST